jgi:enamine deaminase RidA (YjgF/YER057c/UK114 family)
MLQRSNPAGVPAPVGAYHHVVTVAAGTDLAFVSGQVGTYLDGRPVDPDPAAQTRQAYANLGAIVAGLGATPGDIVKFTTFVVGAEALAGFRAARPPVFDEWFPGGEVPASTLVLVAGLAAPEFLVEIEAVVALPRS